MIEIRNLNYGYTDVRVLKDISLNFEAGKIYGVLGHNGAGKTTLFRAILGLVKIKAGEVKRSGVDSVSYLPENNGVYDKLTVMENLEYRATLGLLTKEESRQRIYRLISKLKLNKYVDQQTSRLSQGLKKRLAIACMLIKCGDLVLLDEPTNGLDPESRDIIIKMIREVSNDTNTIVINSHDLDFIKVLCDKYFILQEGVFVHESTDFDYLKDKYLEVTAVED